MVEFRVKLITAPASEPLTLVEAKLHLRVDVADDDTLIAALITAARQYCEGVLWRALMPQTWELYLDEWPCEEIELPKPPLQSVTSVKYTNSIGATTTMDAGDYTVDTASEPGRVVLNYGELWPTVTLATANPIAIRYVCGYADAAHVPETVKAAMKLLIGHLYENREAVVAGLIVTSVPLAVESLLGLDLVR